MFLNFGSAFGQERRPNAIAGGFNNGRDFFQNQQDDRNSGEPLLSVEDIDIGNRLKRKCTNNQHVGI